MSQRVTESYLKRTGASEMWLKAWDRLPEAMRTDEVRRYYDILRKRRAGRIGKRIFDVLFSALLLLIASPVFLLLAVAIKLDSKGPVFYRQVRVTQYGKEFRIFKFRSMAEHADRGSQVTVKGDTRITRVGRVIRKYRLDELAQLLDIFRGTMTFVGTRPEVPLYTSQYTPEMMATLLLPAGVTSMASICYKDEADLLAGGGDTDRIYVEQILPAKMKYNLEALERFGFWEDMKVMVWTVLAVLGE